MNTKNTEQKMTDLFNSTNTIFAFSAKQFNEQKKDGIKYVNLGAGMLCQMENVDTLIEGLERINKEDRAEKLERLGVDKLILDTLLNYEAFYTYDISDAMEELKAYHFSEEKVWEIFNKNKDKFDN